MTERGTTTYSGKADERKKLWPPKPPKWWLTVPLFSMALATFYGQGRMYRESYLDVFGINASQFPISAADAYWFALNSYARLIGTAGSHFLRNYPRYLYAIAPVLVIGLLLRFLAGSEAIRRGFRRFHRWVKRRQYVTPKPPLRAKYFVALTTWLLTAPVFIGIFIMVLAALLTTFVLPWIALGQQEAKEECQAIAKTSPLVSFAGDKRVEFDKQASPTARLLLCGSDFCALIRDGATLVIQRTAVQRIEAISIADLESLETKVTEKASSVPDQETLCYRPPPKPASR